MQNFIVIQGWIKDKPMPNRNAKLKGKIIRGKKKDSNSTQFSAINFTQEFQKSKDSISIDRNYRRKVHPK